MGVISHGYDNWTIENCNICHNGEAGVELHSQLGNGCEHVTIKKCHIYNNTYVGIHITYDSSNNKIFHNNFKDNGMSNAHDLGFNQWDHGYPSGGNYWDDYAASDTDGDGIGDIPYNIPGGSNQDLYPLIHPCGSVTNLDTSEVFLTIQGAIDDSDTLAGHTIYVKNGKYYENVDITKDGINLIGENKNSTIIDANRIGNGISISIPSHYIEISNFTIKNASGCGIVFNDPISGRDVKHNTIYNCIIYNNSGNVDWRDGFGIAIAPHDGRIENNTISHCDIFNNGASGIMIYSSAYGETTNNKILNCNISNNGFQPGWWIGGYSRTGIAITGSSGYNRNTLIYNCEVYNNAGDGLFKDRGTLASGTSIINNSFYNNAGYGINITGGSTEDVIYHNNLINNGQNAYDDGTNTWYNTTLQEGNFWSDYTGTDADDDGTGDTPYNISGGSNQDMYPLGYFQNIPPMANFTYSPSSPTDLDVIQFTDTSTDSDGTIASWHWEFGDGDTSTLQNPTHQYADDGTYTVILNVTDDDGASNETTQQIVVANVAPVANDDCYSVAENGTLYISAPGVLGNDTDAEGDSLSASLMSNVLNGILTLFDNGSFGYAPTVGYNGTDSFTYKAFDGIDYSNEATVTIWVISNHPPYTPNNPSPSDGKTNVDKNKVLSWSGGDPDSGDAVTYDVYFGTSSPPSKISSNQSGTNYDPGTMSYNTKYYWKIITWDKNDTSAEGLIWSFTTEKESTQPPYNPPYNPPSTNQDPIANASASETLGFINIPVIFDGSLSSDEDGSITNYTWNFGDKTAGYGNVITHAYVSPDEYIVTLTVTDNDGAIDDDTITVVISKPNIPPTAPEVDGASSGAQNTEYIYSAVSTDADNDTIQYLFDWGDGETTTTDFLPNGTATTQTHSWATAGEFTISVKAYDNETESGTIKYTVLIDVWLIDDEIKGYLVDEDGDGTYDLFDSSENGEKTTVEKQDDGTYLIDIDGDGSWDHTFSMTEGLSVYREKENNGTPGFEFIILMCAIAVFLSLKRKRKA